MSPRFILTIYYNRYLEFVDVKIVKSVKSVTLDIEESYKLICDNLLAPGVVATSFAAGLMEDDFGSMERIGRDFARGQGCARLSSNRRFTASGAIPGIEHHVIYEPCPMVANQPEAELGKALSRTTA